MFILMAIGFLCRKKGMIHEETGKDLTAILVYIVGPCLIINAFERPASASLVKDFGLTFLAGSLNYLFPIDFSSLLLRLPCLKNDPDKQLIAFGAVYNNCGFIVMLSLLANRPVAFPMRGLCLSTLLSVVSVPLIIMLANWLKQLL